MDAAEETEPRRWIGGVAVGVYAGVGAVALRRYLFWWATIAVGHELTSSTWSPLLGFLTRGYPTAQWAAFIPITALLAWLWLAMVRRAELPARVPAALLLAAAAVYGARHTWASALQPIASFARPDTQILLAGLLEVGLLLWLPTPRRWESPLRSRGGLALLMLLPLVPVALYTQMSVATHLWARAWEQRLRQVEVPVPPGATEVHDQSSFGVRTVKFSVRESYPSTAVADLYVRHFAGLGWRQDNSRPRWRQSDWYSTRPSGQRQVEYISMWTSPDGATSCIVDLLYQAPEGTEARLPVERWQRAWLQVQQVRVLLSPEKPFG
jgi:hypothetical protein